MKEVGDRWKATSGRYNHITRIKSQKLGGEYITSDGYFDSKEQSRNLYGENAALLRGKKGLHRMKSVNGDGQDCEMVSDSLDQMDDFSQFSVNIPQGETKENDLFNKSKSNSDNMKSESCLTNLKTYEKLDYRNQGLSRLPSHELSSKLRSIKISFNSLKRFPEKLCDLIFLRSLYIDNNQIENLPAAIGKLTNLKVLDVHSNCIGEIPKEIGQCASLKRVSIKNNKFTSIPSSMGKLANLAVLDIEWFKYCIPPIRIAEKNGKIRQESMKPCIEKFKELCNMFEGCGNPTLSAFLIYFSQDSDLKSGKEPDYNRRDNRKRTILHRAATAGHIGVIRGLLNIENIDPNKLEKDQCTPLGLALRDDHEEIANILIEKEKVDVNLGGGSFGAPIHIAVSRNKVKTLLKLVKRNVDINKVDFKLQTPLHIIMDVFTRNTRLAEEITRVLVFNGAKPNQMDSDQLTPLHHAVTKKHQEGVELICKLNKVLQARNKETFDFDLAGGDKGFTPIYYALERRAIPIAELLFVNGARVCLRFHNKYEPKEWKKTETSVRRHILWKMEKFELDLRCNRIKMTPKKMNDPQMVKSIEGETENCFTCYTNVGDYLTKYSEVYRDNYINRRRHFIKKNGVKSQQKKLFTYCSPSMKKGDVEIEDICSESDIDKEESRTSICSERNNDTPLVNRMNTCSQMNMEALAVPESLSVNNDNHFKGLNIFLLRDQILSTTIECPNIAFEAIQNLFLTDFDRTLKVNFKAVLKDLAKGLDMIKFQRVVIRTIDLLQIKGDEEIAGILESYLHKADEKREVIEVFWEYEDRSLLLNPYTQRCLRSCIKNIKNNCESLRKDERVPYKNRFAQRKDSRKTHTRSANRAIKIPTMNSKLPSISLAINSTKKIRRKGTDLTTCKPTPNGNLFASNIHKSSVLPTTDWNSNNSSETPSTKKIPKNDYNKYLPPKLSYASKKKQSLHNKPLCPKTIRTVPRSNYIH
ncbi:unnamed protein product [Moneuplotes crassus]|uniref:Disease resistance R13L4/SHOC-2-like LRR domain-containing protein n=1 Tax=Euplotes crassus TaxID=5936 RepID=A0AAD1XWZ8_EUPCR|nr:unnamed protein product [Moneuplotes crassus]